MQLPSPFDNSFVYILSQGYSLRIVKLVLMRFSSQTGCWQMSVSSSTCWLAHLSHSFSELKIHHLSKFHTIPSGNADRSSLQDTCKTFGLVYSVALRETLFSSVNRGPSWCWKCHIGLNPVGDSSSFFLCHARVMLIITPLMLISRA